MVQERNILASVVEGGGLLRECGPAGFNGMRGLLGNDRILKA